MTINLSGFPWWLEDRESCVDSTITFQFSGIEESEISLEWFSPDEFDEDLDEFSVERMDKQAWNSGAEASVYCSAPLKDKFAILSVVDRFLIFSGCPFGMGRFLNIPSFETFDKYTSSSSYLICSAPQSVCERVVAELDRQQVQYSTIHQAPREDDRLLIKLLGGYLICEAAIAIFDS